MGARPNFMKAAPVMKRMALQPGLFDQALVHTGQHFDHEMSAVFFEEFDLPEVQANLAVGSGSHVWQTAQVMLRLEPRLESLKPDWVLLYGDVNSTLAGALACVKLGIPTAHVEAGLRSFNRDMPEEVNRVLVDQVADLLFTPSPDADRNLLREGIPAQRIHFVGNVMIDTLVRFLPRAKERIRGLLTQLGLDRYILATLHRPGNVDDDATLAQIISALSEISRELQVLLPLHPRTRRRIEALGLDVSAPKLHLREPFGYIDFLALQQRAELVVSDSGGIQEETTFLGIPCLTVRPETERPVTLELGTNRLVDATRSTLLRSMRQALSEEKRPGAIPRLWDGNSSQRIVEILASQSGG